MLLTIPLLHHITTGLLRIPLSETATFSEIRREIRPPLLQLLKHGALAKLLGNHLAPIKASIQGKNPFRFEDLRSLATALETPEGQSALAVFPDPLVTQGLNLEVREGEPVIDLEATPPRFPMERFTVTEPRIVREGSWTLITKAWDPETGRFVAIKGVEYEQNPALWRDSERIANEARLLVPLSRIASPHLVSGAVELFRDEQDSNVLVREWLEGENLYDRIEREGPVPLFEALSLVIDWAVGLEAAHVIDRTHGDIESANNLFIHEERGGIVIDFEPRLRKGPETDLTDLLFGLYYALSGNPNLSCEAFWKSYATGYHFFDKLGLPNQISDQLVAIVQRALRTRQGMFQKGPGDDSFENIAQLREKFEALRDTLEECP